MPGMLRLMMGLLTLWAVSVSTAADLQYRLETGNLTGVNDQPIPPAEGYGVITLAEPLAGVVWPVAAGCTVGQWDWTQVDRGGGRHGCRWGHGRPCRPPVVFK